MNAERRTRSRSSHWLSCIFECYHLINSRNVYPSHCDAVIQLLIVNRVDFDVGYVGITSVVYTPLQYSDRLSFVIESPQRNVATSLTTRMTHQCNGRSMRYRCDTSDMAKIVLGGSERRKTMTGDGQTTQTGHTSMSVASRSR